MDPFAEKYYDISPYAYCAGDPVNIVDNDGNMWYSYQNADNEKAYYYSEEQLSEDEQKKNGFSEIGYYFNDGDHYYSLFGNTLDASSLDSKIYEKIEMIKENLQPELRSRLRNKRSTTNSSNI